MSAGKQPGSGLTVFGLLKLASLGSLTVFWPTVSGFPVFPVFPVFWTKIRSAGKQPGTGLTGFELLELVTLGSLTVFGEQ